MNYNGNEYFYITNLQGDIIELVDITGNIVATYRYDAWGNIISKFGAISDINPYRYRGYRWDEESGYYYLNSRYYNPQTGRFINSDGLLGPKGMILSHNSYIYTQNNPIYYTDPNGTFICAGLCLGAATYGLVLLVAFLIVATETVEGDDIANKYFNEPSLEIGNFSECGLEGCTNTTGVAFNLNYGIHEGGLKGELKYRLFDVNFSAILGYTSNKKPRFAVASRISVIELYVEETRLNLGIIDVTITGSINIGWGLEYDLLNKKKSFGIFGGSLDVTFD